MWRGASLLVVVVACRLHFDPTGTPSDADSDSSTDPSADASPDAAISPVVQAVSLDTLGVSIVIGAAGGLAPVTAGNMVLLVCGGFNGTSPCAPSSTPPATWQQIDPGTTLGVYVACNAPAITQINVVNKGQDLNAVVTEWSGAIASAACFDTSRISTPCPTAPAAWNTLSTAQPVSQNRELIVAVGHAGAQNAGWTVDPPYQIAANALGVNAGVNVLVAYQEVDATPMAYSATGTVNQWATACFTDVFAFRAQ
jgi:hypothetical protein